LTAFGIDGILDVALCFSSAVDAGNTLEIDGDSMTQRRYLKEDDEFGDGPLTQRRIDEHVEKTDGFVPRRTSQPPSSHNRYVDPYDDEMPSGERLTRP
jgi:hypothetical protein